MRTELEKFYSTIESIKIAMMTTRGKDGHLFSRPMANQKWVEGADLWFVTAEGSPKLQELMADPHVNVAYFNSSSMEWISASGVATISRDRDKIAALYEEDWKVWFPKEGDPRHGTIDDPRFVLIGVDIHAAQFLEVNKPKPVVLYEIAKGWLTGTDPQIGETHFLKEPHRHASVVE